MKTVEGCQAGEDDDDDDSDGDASDPEQSTAADLDQNNALQSTDRVTGGWTGPKDRLPVRLMWRRGQRND